ncbi:hypothetical protein N0V84_009362 [Fusarium piperis]|uniref:MFS general substrate transporter n=1 Tax=Fusarium piperis TaxID=1435070 RepID=A0A9W8W6J2_9HYPO|nr:hypothetical protein N0V84_009362 [Fusarium piperis]
MSLDVETHPVTWHRSSIFAAFIVAATAFTLPGVFGALNGMGAGGGAKPEISNAANAIVFGVLAVGSIFVGAICNTITPKWTLVAGTLGYVPYAAGFYVVDKYGKDWLLLFGSVTCGLSACFLWVASGAILLGYPEENRKGIAISIKFALQNLGASIGGIISFALNIRRAYRGSISNATYVVLIVIMCLGFPFALLLPKASRVERADGRKVIIRKSPSFLNEFHLLAKLIRIPTVLAIVPLMLYAQWFLSYQWQFNFAYFTVRHRALNSMLFYITGLIAALLFGALLDWERFTRKTRARIGFIILLVTTGSSWILGQAVQVHFSKTTPTLDWAEGGSAGLGTFTFLWWGAVDPLVMTYMYWLAGSLTNNVNEATFLTALINSVGCVGSTMGFVISTMKFSYNGSCAINLALFVLAMPSLSWVAFTKVSDTSHGGSLTGLADADAAAYTTKDNIVDAKTAGIVSEKSISTR